MVNQTEKDRRKYKRFPYREDVLIDGVIRSTSIDISEGGLYLCAVYPYDINSVIEITFPVGAEKIKVKAKVQYSQQGIGMGVMFIDLREEQRRKVRRLIESFTTVKSIQPKGEDKNILLVEDNELFRENLKNRLLEAGFQVVEASDGIEAIKYLAEHTPDLIILDLYMEKMDGFKVLSILKIHSVWKDLPVIACSAIGTQDVMQKVIEAGADEFLNKMITSPSQLVEIAKAVLFRSSRDH